MVQVNPKQKDEMIEAGINFLVDTGIKPVNVPSTPGGGKSEHIGEYETKMVSITNGRPLTAELSLDREGFALVKLETGVTDFYDERQIEDIYNTELEVFLIQELAAKKVGVFDHTLRAGDEGIRRVKKVREPVQRAHNDYTVKDLADETDGVSLEQARLVKRGVKGARAPFDICNTHF